MRASIAGDNTRIAKEEALQVRASKRAESFDVRLPLQSFQEFGDLRQVLSEHRSRGLPSDSFGVIRAGGRRSPCGQPRRRSCSQHLGVT